MKYFGLNMKGYAASALLATSFLFLFAGDVFAGGSISVMPDKSLLVQIVNFLFRIWALNLILYRPIRNILIQRKEKVTGLEEGIEVLNQSVKEKDEAYHEGLKEARASGLEKKGALLQEASEEEGKIIEEINKKAQADLAKVREKIAVDVEDIRSSLQQELDAFAKAIGEKILGRAV